jgi:CBS domain-containing protein
MIVSHMMSRNVETCRPKDSLAFAAGKMWDRDIGCLPVVDEDGRVVGTVTDRDVCMAAYTQGRPLDAMYVESAMARNTYFCAPGDRVEDAVAAMRAHQVRRLPVVDPGGHLVGIVSLGDVALESARELGRKAPDIAADGLVAALAAISEPRMPNDVPSSAHVYQSRSTEHRDEIALQMSRA